MSFAMDVVEQPGEQSLEQRWQQQQNTHIAGSSSSSWQESEFTVHIAGFVHPVPEAQSWRRGSSWQESGACNDERGDSVASGDCRSSRSSSSYGECDSDASSDNTNTSDSSAGAVSFGKKKFTAAFRYCKRFEISKLEFIFHSSWKHAEDMQLAPVYIPFFLEIREMKCVSCRFQMHYPAKEFLAQAHGLGKCGNSGIWLQSIEKVRPLKPSESKNGWPHEPLEEPEPLEEQEWCWHWLLADLDWESMLRAVTGERRGVGICGCSIEPRQTRSNRFSVLDSDLKIWRTDGSILVMMLQHSGKQIPCFETRIIHGEPAKKWYVPPLVFD